MRADRLLSIVLLLQRTGHQTAGQLAQALEVSMRTIYRDMISLSGAGIPVLADATGYRLVGGYRTQLTGLTPDEARGLVLAGLPRAAEDLGLARAVAAAELKLSAALPEPVREGADRMRQRFLVDAPGWYHDGDRSDHLGAVADAVWQQRVISVRYESWKGVVDHRLEPYGLVLKAGKWYLVARTGRGLATFRVNQIHQLTTLPEGFDRRCDFDLADYWAEHITHFRARLHQGEALVRLAPAALPRLAHLMSEAVAEAAQQGDPQPDGWVLARVPIESQEHAEGAFLRLGAQVEVLEPESLRDRIAATVAQLATLYPAPAITPQGPSHTRAPGKSPARGSAAARRAGAPPAPAVAPAR